jgi:hypothetical protein
MMIVPWTGPHSCPDPFHEPAPSDRVAEEAAAEGYVLVVWSDGSNVVVAEELFEDDAFSLADLRKMNEQTPRFESKGKSAGS